ncbi:hypothetical protein [Phenylobacterium sp. J367]|uniref:hypothetical protein n=1 Tax=Phenylobacterium sp. J367 TaxID=2898435 RepID=UPI002151DA38|nr:hypothetical protein [Phenylobacterium sp. J367]MCR5880639.1 hypothetical protein [Phenylobacterium sp. J367]
MRTIVLLLALSLPTAAGAAPVDPVTAVLNAAVRADTSAPRIRLEMPASDAEAYALRSAGIARTAVERRSDGATASLGFLCGLQNGAGRTGSAAVRGDDPMGRFLGARLSLAFR